MRAIAHRIGVTVVAPRRDGIPLRTDLRYWGARSVTGTVPGTVPLPLMINVIELEDKYCVSTHRAEGSDRERRKESHSAAVPHEGRSEDDERGREKADFGDTTSIELYLPEVEKNVSEAVDFAVAPLLSPPLHPLTPEILMAVLSTFPPRRNRRRGVLV